MNYGDIIDISKMIAPDTAVWPGDTPFRKEMKSSLDSGGIVNLTTLTISAHTASHADAPYHVDNDGHTIDEVNLSYYWGPAQVVTINITNRALVPGDFEAFDLALAPRLLVRTPAGELPYNRFPDQYPYPSPLLADYLARQGIILYGTDAPSMDALDSQALPGHHAIITNGIAILEGLDLSMASDGLYELCALPLKIKGGDGSPIRAALRRLNQ